MSKYPPKPQGGHLWEGEVSGKPLFEFAPAFFEAGTWIGKPHAKGSYHSKNDVVRWSTDYALNMKERRWLPFRTLAVARGVKTRCAECVNDPKRCICIHRFFEFLENGFKPLPEQLILFKEVA